MKKNIYIIFAIVFVLVNLSCKSNKIAESESLTMQQHVDQAKKRLLVAMDNEKLSIESKLKLIDEIREQDYLDLSLTSLLDRNEKFLKEQQFIDSETERRINERNKLELEKNAKAVKVQADVLRFFESIANATDTESANSIINEALKIFESKHAPVLIIIKKTGNLKEYDRPSSILRYLEHIKDFKIYESKIENITFNESNGKISELELIK